MKKEIFLIRFFFVLLDFIFFFVSLALVLFFRFPTEFSFRFQEHFFPFFFLFPFYLLFLISFGFYHLYFFNLKNLFLSLFNFLFSSLIFSAVYFYFTQTVFALSPKTNLLLFLILFSFFLILSRLFFFKVFQKKKLPLYFLATFKRAQEKVLEEKLIKDLKNHPFFEYKGTLNHLEEGIVVVSPFYKFKASAFDKFLNKNIVIFGFVEFYEKFFGRIPLEAIDEDWLMKEIFWGESKFYYYLKRFLDIFLAFCLFIFLFLPLFLPISFLIYLSSPGSIFFLNERVGYQGKIFKLIKFRTMHPKREKEQKWAVGEEEKRIFFFGKILRKTHLDELPQIFNIFKGELSFVGPRPEQPKIFEELEKKIKFYSLRTLVLPGFTGWAQVNYKYPENLEETKIKLEYDFYYLKNYNLFLDILIVIKTIQLLYKKL